MEYRNFIIKENSWPGAEYVYTHKEFDGPEDNRSGVASSIKDAIEYIDEYYGSKMDYRVSREKVLGQTITKFATWQEAFNFCMKYDICPTNIETYVLGEKINFDSI